MNVICYIIRDALANAGLLELTCVQAINNQEREQIWVRDDRNHQQGARWCVIEAFNSKLYIDNGRPPREIINLADPNSLNKLGTTIDEALLTTTLFATPDVSD